MDINLLSEIVVPVATVIVLILGLKEWKKQLKEKTEYEQSLRLIEATYKVRDAIQFARNPFTVQTSDNDRKKEYENRWESVQREYRNNLEIEIKKAEALWGNEICELVKPLQNCISDLKYYLNKHLYQKPHNYTGGDAKATEQHEREIMEKIVYKKSNDKRISLLKN